MRPVRAIVVVLSAGALLGAPTAVAASSAHRAALHTQTASLGPVSATLTFADAAKGSPSPYAGISLQIADGSTVLRSGPLTTRACGTLCEPGATGAVSSLHVVDMNGDGTTEVVVDLFTGGAHCCSVDVIFSVDPAGALSAPVERNWGDPGARLVDLSHNGRLEFLTADDRFAYRFDAFAFSALPLLVERFQHGSFHDVTNAYPSLIAGELRGFLRAYRTQYRHRTGLGYLAAWAADEYRLHRRAVVTRFLARELRRGHLRSDGPAWPGGARYVRELKRFLMRAGYDR